MDEKEEDEEIGELDSSFSDILDFSTFGLLVSRLISSNEHEAIIDASFSFDFGVSAKLINSKFSWLISWNESSSFISNICPWKSSRILPPFSKGYYGISLLGLLSFYWLIWSGSSGRWIASSSLTSSITGFSSSSAYIYWSCCGFISTKDDLGF